MSKKPKKKTPDDGLTEGETRFIESTISVYATEQALFKGWIQVAFASEKKLASGPIEKVIKFQKRILVVGKYRIFLIERGTVRGKKSIDKNFHLFELSELSLTQGFLLIKLDKQSGALCIKSERYKEIVQFIRNSYRKISFGFGKYSMIVNIPEDALLPIEETPPSAANGLVENYIAQCSYAHSRVSPAFIQYVEDLVQEQSFVMDLSSCPGIEPKTPISLDLNVIANSLALNNYFRVLVFKDISVSKLDLRSVIAFNSTITKLVISKIDGIVNWIGIGEGLASNKDHAIQIIEFSHVELNLRESISLAQGFQMFPHALKKLNLSHCGLGGKAIHMLFEAFEKNFAMSLTIEELDLSGNKIEDVGSNAIANWLSKVREYSALTKLVLCNSSLNVTTIGTWLRNMKTLVHLDISGNRITKEASHSLRVVLDSTNSLSELKVSSCKLTSEQVEEIAMGSLRNSRINDIHLDFSYNECSSFDFWKEVFAAKYNLQSLDLTGIRLKSGGLISVLKSLSAFCITLSSLSLGKNLGNESGEEVARTLGEFISLNANLRKLSLCGTKGSRFRSSLLHFFPSLAVNESLQELDLEGNKMGDETFFALTNILRTNKGLKILSFDDNDISINGFLSLQTLLRHHKTLIQISYPHKDLEQSIEHLNQPKKKEKLREIVEKILLQVEINRLNSLKESPEREDFPTTIAPLAQLPEHLATFQSFNEFMHSKETLRPFRPYYEAENLVPSDNFESPEEKDINSNSEKDNPEPEKEEEVESKMPSSTPSGPKPSQNQAQPLEVCIALYDYTPKEDNELGFKENDHVTVLEKFENNDWWKGQANGKVGFFPSNYVKSIRETVVALCTFVATEDNELSFAEGDRINVLEKFDNSEWWKGELKGKIGFFPHTMCSLQEDKEE